MKSLVSTLLQRSTLMVTSFILAISSLSAAMPLFLSQNANAVSTSSTVIVTQNDLASTPLAGLSKWFMYNDSNDTIDNSLGSFVPGPSTPLSGVGSVQFTLGVYPNDRKNIATYQFGGTKLVDITNMSYVADSKSGNGPNQSPFLNFNIDFDGTDSWQNRLVYVPSANGLVPQDTWNTFDTINGGNALWTWSKYYSNGNKWPDGNTNQYRTLNDIIAQWPGARIRVSDPWLGVRVGNPGPTGYTGSVDSFTFGTAAGTTKYDFEPTPTAVPTGITFVKDSTNATIASGSTVNYSGVTMKWTPVPNAERYQIRVTDPTGAQQSSRYTGWYTFDLNDTTRYGFFGSQQGEWKYEVRTKDATTGLWSNYSTPLSLSYDTQSPTAQFTTTPPQYVNGNFHVTGTANDNIKLKNVFFDVRDSGGWVAGCVSGSTSLVYDVNQQNATIGCDINTANLVDGQSYTLRIHVSDYAGYGGGQSATIIVDRTAPNISWQLQPEAFYGLGDGFHVRPITSEVGTTKSIYIDSVDPSNLVWTATNTQKNFDTKNTNNQVLWDGLSDGTHHFIAVFVDYAGNSTTSESSSFVIDRKEPTVTIDGTTPKSLYGNSTNISVHVSDINYQKTELYHSGDSSPFKTYTGAYFGLFWLSEGDYEMVSYDMAGNTVSYSFTIDRTDPTITVKSGYVGDKTAKIFSNVSFSLYDAHQVDKYVINGYTSDFGNNKWSDANFQNIKSHLIEGNNVLVLYDVAGNSTTYEFTYDNTAPVVSVTAPAAGNYGFINTVNINADIDDAVSYRLLVNGSEVATGGSTFTTYALPVVDGTYDIQVEATDAAGNVGTSSVTTINVDDTAPLLTVVGYTGTSLTPTITGTTDNATDTVTVDGAAATVSPTANGIGTFNWTYTLPTQTVGSHTITVVSTDTFGNATTETANVTVNSIPATQTTPASTTTTVTPTGTTTTNTGDQAVLGDQTTNNDAAKADDTKANPSPSILGDTTSNPMNLFGLAWYWWLVILAAIIAAWWIIAAALRRRDNQNV
ncbi:MAG TPA: hypothetical protein PKC86_00990 [Candidatus Saccharibacteria bacterium]|nr:hypothetical protein [Candidatus Saccharibacteria bacterium]